MKPQLNLRPLKQDRSMTSTISSVNRRPNLSRPTRKCRPSRSRRGKDRFGLDLTTNAEAAESYSIALDRLLALEIGAEQRLEESLRIDPGFALGHAVAATILAERDGEQAQVHAHLDSARRAAGAASDREASFINAAGLWCSKDLAGETSLLRHVQRWPADAYAVSLLTPSIASAGVSDGVVEVWPLLDDLVAVHGDDWWLMSIRAFGRTEQRRWDEAEEYARTALAAQPSSGHAAHALAHVLYETGRHHEVLAWLDRWIASDGAHQLFRGHFEWHAALIEVAAGDIDAVRSRFDRELACLRGNRALVDAGSLLVRASLHGCGLGRRRPDAVDHAAGPASRRPSSPFLSWHAALLAAIRADTDRLADLQAQAKQEAETSGRYKSAWPQVADVCAAMAALTRNEPAHAAGLLSGLGDTSPMGGSPAQREILDDICRACLH